VGRTVGRTVEGLVVGTTDGAREMLASPLLLESPQSCESLVPPLPLESPLPFDPLVVSPTTLVGLRVGEMVGLVGAIVG